VSVSESKWDDGEVYVKDAADTAVHEDGRRRTTGYLSDDGITEECGSTDQPTVDYVTVTRRRYGSAPNNLRSSAYFQTPVDRAKVPLRTS